MVVKGKVADMSGRIGSGYMNFTRGAQSLVRRAKRLSQKNPSAILDFGSLSVPHCFPCPVELITRVLTSDGRYKDSPQKISTQSASWNGKTCVSRRQNETQLGRPFARRRFVQKHALVARPCIRPRP